MILVVGSTGLLGGEICRRLTRQGKDVRGLVRATSHPGRVAVLNAWGVETVVGDLRDPLSLDRACLGAETVITTATAFPSRQPGDSIVATDQQGQLNLVQAAHTHGARHFVYISQVGNGDAVAPVCPLSAAKRLVEQAVLESGLTYTILRPCDFMETWLSPAMGFDFRNARATIYGEGHARVSFISVGDVAQCVVESVGNVAAGNQIIELGGPAALSPLEVVRIFEKVSGQSFELQFVPAAVLKAQKEATNDPLQQSMAAARFAQTKGSAVDPGLARRTFSFALTSVEEFARRLWAQNVRAGTSRMRTEARP